MAELELVRVDRDGGSLVLRAPDGTRYVLPVTDALRAAVRPALEAPVHDDATAGPVTTPPAAAPARPDLESSLRPRDVQARLRAAATVEELAPLAGMPIEHVRRYEWPVIAERAHVIGQVRAHEVPGLSGASELGEVADARLAARGVLQGDAVWSARREGSAPWVVEVRFAAGDRERSARWTFDPRARVVTPLDDEARWLGQPDDPLSPEVRGVPSVSARRALPPVDEETDLLLDDLAGRRGSRPAHRAHRPPTASVPAVGHPAGRGRAAGDDEAAAFDVVPLGDAPVRDRTRLRSPGPEGAADADADAALEHGQRTNVVDFGRWNPRRSRDRSVSPGAGPGASQPALIPVKGDPAPEPARVTGPVTGSMPRVGAPAGPGSLSSSSGDAGTPGPRAEPPTPGVVSPGAVTSGAVTSGAIPSGAVTSGAVTATGSPETPSRGVPGTRRSRKNRAPVPSWDEIVFGQRPDQG